MTEGAEKKGRMADATQTMFLGHFTSIIMGLAVRFSVKVIACAVLVLVMVPATLLALSYSPQPASVPYPSPTPSPSSVSQMFNVDLVYAYVGPINVTEHSHFGMQVHSANLYPVYIYLNYTYLGNPFDEPYDAIFEGYHIQLVSDTRVSANYTAYEGLELNQSSSAWPVTPDADTVCFSFNMTVNESFLMQITDSGSFTSGDSSLGLWSRGQPNTITLTLRRAGWWTVQGGSVSIVDNPASAEVLLEVQLEAFGDGFLYNKLVPENELTTMNPFDPPV